MKFTITKIQATNNYMCLLLLDQTWHLHILFYHQVYSTAKLATICAVHLIPPSFSPLSSCFPSFSALSSPLSSPTSNAASEWVLRCWSLGGSKSRRVDRWSFLGLFIFVDAWEEFWREGGSGRCEFYEWFGSTCSSIVLVNS